MATLAETIRLVISGDASGAVSALRSLGAEVKKADGQITGAGSRLGKAFMENSEAIKSAGRSMTAFVSLPIVAALGAATKAAIDENQQMALFNNTLRENASATQEQIDAVEKWIAKVQEATGYTDGELRPALENLVRATKDIGTAQEYMGVALDIAAAKGLAVEQVTAAMAKAYNGNVGALGRLGIATKDASGKALDFAGVMEQAKRTFGGSAAAAAETTAGKLKILKARFGDLAEDIGRVLIPMVERAADVIGFLSKILTSMPAAGRSLIVYFGLFAAALGPALWALGSVADGVRALADAKRFLTTLTKASTVATAAETVAEGASTTATAANTTATAANATASNAAAAAKWRLVGGLKAATLAAGPWIAALAAIGVAVWKTIDAYKQMKAAQAFLEKQTAEAQANEEAALTRIREKYGENSEQYRKLVAAVQEADRQLAESRKRELQGLAGWIDSWLAGLHSTYGNWSPAGLAGGVASRALRGVAGWFASGGDFIVSRPTLIGVGERGPERVTITPRGAARPSGTSIYLGGIHIGHLSGTDEAAARRFADKVAGEVLRRLEMAAATGF